MSDIVDRLRAMNAVLRDGIEARLKVKMIHAAHKINSNGDVSALCFKRVRPIDLRKATWTIVPSKVTCGKCLKALHDAVQHPSS